MPEARALRYSKEFGLSQEEATSLVSDRSTADFYEQCVLKTAAKPATVYNWLNGELGSHINKAELHISDSPVSAEALAGLLDRIHDNTISGKIAKEVLTEMWTSKGSADEIIEAKGLKQITDSGAIESIVKDILANHPDQVEQYQAGEQKMIGFFVGQVMKASQGKANPKQANELLRKLLGL